MNSTSKVATICTATVMIGAALIGSAAKAESSRAATSDERARTAQGLFQRGFTDAEVRRRTGFEKVGGSREVGPSTHSASEPFWKNTSSPEDVIVKTSVIYDNITKVNYAFVEYSWKDRATLAGESYFFLSRYAPIPWVLNGGLYNVGGRDGLSITFSQPVLAKGEPSAWLTWGDANIDGKPADEQGYKANLIQNGMAAPTGTQKPLTVSGNNTPTGAMFEWQDQIQEMNCRSTTFDLKLDQTCFQYNSAKGTLMYKFEKKDPGCLQIYGNYGHGWSDAEVSGVGVGVDGKPTITFASAKDSWPAAANITEMDCMRSPS